MVKDYLKLCVDYDNSVGNTKYTIEKMYKLNGDKIQKKKFSRDFENAETLEQIWYAYCIVLNFLNCNYILRHICIAICSRYWDLGNYCRQIQGVYDAKGLVHLPCSPRTRMEDMPNELVEYRKHMYADQNIKFALMRFQRKYFGLGTLPKVLLHGYCGKNKIPLPIYETRREDRLYYSVITFNGQKFASLIWDRDKRHAEQSAALVVCHQLGLFEEHFLVVIGCLLDKLPDDQHITADAL